ncbi:MAG: PEP-CTERM sorting domain-containing protein [Isosphaeraceae bacterium]
MHTMRGWTGLRSAVIALGLVAWTVTDAEAAKLKYQTSTSIDSKGVSGPNAISFVPVSSRSIDLSGGTANAQLGKFVLAPLPDKTTTVYDNTKFSITFLPKSLDDKPADEGDPLTFTGYLNGKVTGDSLSTVTATFDKAPATMYSIGNQTVHFKLPDSSLSLVADQAGGETTAQTQILATSSGSESPVPEPSTVALFFTTVGGLGLRRYVLARRKSRA